MKCPNCGSEIKENKDRDVVWDRGRTAFCNKCHIEYRIDDETNDIIYTQPTTAEMLLDGAEKTGYIEAIRLVKNRKWSVTIGGYQGLSEKLSEAILIAYKEAIRNEEIKQAYEWARKQEE